MEKFVSENDREALRARIKEDLRILAEHDKTNPDVEYWEKVMALNPIEGWK